MDITLADLSEPIEIDANNWNGEGVVILPSLIPVPMIRAYEEEWKLANGFTSWVRAERTWLVGAERPGGWPDCTPYMRHPALAEICCYGPLGDALEKTLGEPAGVHLNLTGWVTTERDWHQDTYLNEPEVGDFYAAVWIALGHVEPESGPFQYVPGSHLWHRLLRERIAAHVDMDDPAWPKLTEDFLTPMVEAEIERREAEVVTYMPSAGDVLLWHPRLYHRGSRAKVPGTYRPGLIAHYSGIHHRPQMPTPVQHPLGGWLFPIPDSGPSS
jgi:hypothetical protein